MFVIAFLASEADPLNVATEALIAWLVDVSEALISAIAIVDDPLILVTIISLAVEADALKPVSILSAISCLAVDADELNSVCDVETDALKLDIGKVDEPLTWSANLFLAADDDPLKLTFINSN